MSGRHLLFREHARGFRAGAKRNFFYIIQPYDYADSYDILLDSQKIKCFFYYTISMI